MYIYSMRKFLDAKILDFETTGRDVRDTAGKIGRAAESQARLNIALTAVAVAALLVAVLVVHDARVSAHG